MSSPDENYMILKFPLLNFQQSRLNSLSLYLLKKIYVMYQMVILSAIMVISATLLTWRWFSVVHGDVDPYVVVYTFLFVLSLGILLLNNLFFMRRAVEEIYGTKRFVSISQKKVEERIEKKLNEGLKEIESRLEDVRKMIYR